MRLTFRAAPLCALVLDLRLGGASSEVDDRAGKSGYSQGTSVGVIDRTYGHLASDSDERIRERLEARSGVELALQSETEDGS